MIRSTAPSTSSGIHSMRIAVIGNYATNLWLFRRSLLEALVEQGHEVMVSAPDFDDDLIERLTRLGVICHPTELKRNGVNPLEDIAYLLRVRRLLKSLRPDLTFAYAIKPVIYGSLAARSLGIRRHYNLVTGLGYTFGGHTLRQRVLSGLVKTLCKAAFGASRRVFVQNPDDAALFLEHRLLPEDKLVVVNGSGIPLGDFERAPLPPGPPIFLFIARLMVEKGIMQFVEAAKLLKGKHPEARFQILGPFDSNPSSIQPDQLQAWVDEGVIEYLGETKDVRPYIADAHVFVLPSFYREGTPRSALEAMAMARPIITTDSPGCRETVIEGENGFLVPPRDHVALAEAIERFIDDPGLIQRASDASRQLAEDKYDVRKVNRTMLDAMGLPAGDRQDIEHRSDEHPASTLPGWSAEERRLKAS